MTIKIYPCGSAALIVFNYGPNVLFKFRVTEAGIRTLVVRLEAVLPDLKPAYYHPH